MLAAGVLAVAVAARGAGVAPDLRRAARLGLTIALLVAVINPLVSSEGETLLVRGWALLGHRFDITLEALAYGALAGVRLLGLVLAFALFSLVVDPDELLRALRRISYRSALTAALATRLVPLLARDASRRSEAARCRARPASRTALARAALAGSLERAVEIAAALEVRGYAGAGGRRSTPKRERSAGSPRRSRHDTRVCAAAAAIVVVVVVAKLSGVAPFSAYPSLELALGAGEAAFAALIVVLAWAPLAGAGARLGTGRPARAAVEAAGG